MNKAGGTGSVRSTPGTMGATERAHPVRLVWFGLALVAASSVFAAAEPGISVDVLLRLKGTSMEKSPAVQDALKRALQENRGNPKFLEIVRAFDLKDQVPGLIEVAAAFPTVSAGAEALQLALDDDGADAIAKALSSPDGKKIAQALRNVADDRAVTLLQSVPEDASSPAAPASSERSLEPLPKLLARPADAARGEHVFREVAGCAACHLVKGKGTDFGPDLSTIGDKYGKEAMYANILDPSAGIAFGFEPWQIRLKNGGTVGLIASETDDELAVKTVGNIVTRYRKDDVVNRRQLETSLMPVGLLQGIGDQDAADLLEFLSTLKADKPKS